MALKALKIAAVAVFAAALGFGATTAKASVASHVSVVKEGGTYGGWTINTPVGIKLFYDGTVDGVAKFEKVAAFSDANEGLIISFVQSTTNLKLVAPKIDIVNEAITNISGTTWTGFFMGVTSPLAPPLTEPTFGSVYSDIGPFTTSNLTGPDTWELGGGSVADGTSFGLGNNAAGGDLLINAYPSGHCLRQVIDFKEQPLVNAVPLPSAAWSGLSGLLGLGLIAHAKKLKKILA